MKLEFKNNLLIIYLYKYLFDYQDNKLLHQEIKTLFINLIKNYHISLFGFLKVDIYENKKYGCILEVSKINDNDLDYLDLKIIIHSNVNFYLVMDKYYFFNLKDVVYKDNKYYINIVNIDNIVKYIEFGNIEYDKK